MYVRDVHGEEAYRKLLERSCLVPSELGDPSCFVSVEEFDALLSGVRALVPDDQAFRSACAHKLSDAYGSIRYVVWATSPATVLRLTAQTIRIVMPQSSCDIVHHSQNSVGMRYTSQHQLETRLMCLSRQAAAIALPTVFGLPAAGLVERSCLAHGDASCEYELTFQARPRWLPALLAAGGGLLVARLLISFGVAELSPMLSLPLLFALAAHTLELRRVMTGNSRIAGEVQAALEQFAQKESEARGEIFEFHQRQRQWAALLEEQVEERTVALEGVLSRIDRLREARTHDLLGFSHDLRNPLTILRASVDAIRPHTAVLPDGEETLDDIRYAVGKMEALLTEMADTLTRDSGTARRAPELIVTHELSEKIRRRMAALLFGRNIRVNVVTRPAAPDKLFADPLLLDRIIDNLLTNAAKYTDRGCVSVELDGVDDCAVIRVKDTGRGIAPDQLERVFMPRGSDPQARASHSLGLGLSVVVRLLSLLGGRLEVASTAGVGSTFSVIIPVVLGPLPARSLVEAGDGHDILRSVVTIHTSGPSNASG